MAGATEAPEDNEATVRALDEGDIALLKTYGLGPYSTKIKDAEKDIKDLSKKVNDVCGVKESDTGLAAPSRWDLVADKQAQQEEQPLQVFVARDVCAHMSCSCCEQPSPVSLSFSKYAHRQLKVQVARCTKIINPNTEDAKYVINVKQIAKVCFVLSHVPA